jgi:hypothetical protein
LIIKPKRYRPGTRPPVAPRERVSRIVGPTAPDPIAPLLGRIADALDPQPLPYADDAAGWIRSQGSWVWSKQEEVCVSVVENRFTAVRACHGVGKSWIAARIVAWWLATHRDAFVVTTAPSAHQVKTILWREIKRAHREGGLEGYITDAEVPMWKIDGEIVAFGRKPADYADEEAAAAAFQGIHATNVLIVIDEADGVPGWLGNAVETLVTNEKGRVLAIGNPMDPSSWFAQAQQPGQDYNVIKISAWDAPWNTGEYVPEEVADNLISEMWVEERRRRWGVGSPLWQGRVEAEYPEVTDDNLIHPRWIREAWERDLSGRGTVDGRMGLDIARFGVDETVLYWNRGGWVRLVDKWSKADTMETVGKVRNIYDDRLDIRDEVPISVDVIGLGAGVYDRMRELRMPAVPFNGSEKANRPDRFRNRRAEQYWSLRELFESGEIDLDPADLDLANELMQIQWSPNSAGQRVVEKKEDIKKRLGRSPDRADAVMMSTFVGSDWQKLAAQSANPAPMRGDAEREPDDLVSDLMAVAL